METVNWVGGAFQPQGSKPNTKQRGICGEQNKIQ